MESCHQHPTSGHMGCKRTLSRISECFVWPGITKDVKKMVNCIVTSSYMCMLFYLFSHMFIASTMLNNLFCSVFCVG